MAWQVAFCVCALINFDCSKLQRKCSSHAAQQKGQDVAKAEVEVEAEAEAEEDENKDEAK